MPIPPYRPNIPNHEERQAMWAAIDFTPITKPFPAIQMYLDELRPLYANGSVEHAAFTVPQHPILDWYLTRNQLHEVGLFERLWMSPSIAVRFPYPLKDLNFFDPKIFSFCSPFLLGGGLAWLLSNGGAYHTFVKDGKEAKRIGEEAAWELLGGDYDTALAYESSLPWSSYFLDICDHTFVVLDRSRGIIHTLLSTDTD
jgi:hypothetical protein